MMYRAVMPGQGRHDACIMGLDRQSVRRSGGVSLCAEVAKHQ